MAKTICPLLMLKADEIEDAQCLKVDCEWYRDTSIDGRYPIYRCAVVAIIDIANNLV